MNVIGNKAASCRQLLWLNAVYSRSRIRWSRCYKDHLLWFLRQRLNVILPRRLVPDPWHYRNDHRAGRVVGSAMVMTLLSYYAFTLFINTMPRSLNMSMNKVAHSTATWLKTKSVTRCQRPRYIACPDHTSRCRKSLTLRQKPINRVCYTTLQK